jgi:hypothetical protein
VQRHGVTLGEGAAHDRRRAGGQMFVEDEKRRLDVVPRKRIQQRGGGGGVRTIVKSQIDGRGCRDRHPPERAVGDVEQERKRGSVGDQSDAGGNEPDHVVIVGQKSKVKGQVKGQRAGQRVLSDHL